MSLLSWIGIFVLIFLVIIWLTHHFYKSKKIPQGPFLETYEYILNSGNRTYDKFFTDPGDLYTKTIGHIYDDTAKMAMQKALKREDMYTKNEQEGSLKNNAGKAAENSFILADLHQFYQEDLDNAELLAASYYNKTLNRILTNPVKAIENKSFTPEFMIDRVETFYDNNKNLQNDIIPNFNNVRKTVRKARKEQVKDNKRLEEKKELFQKPIVNDPQNVHDRNFNYTTKQIYDKLKKVTNNSKEVLATIKKELSESTLSDEKKEDANKILAEIEKGNHSSNLDATEDEILSRVWQRINQPVNKENRENMKVMLFENMADSMEGSYGDKHAVCLTGRCSRILQTLTLLDKDENLSKPIKTADMIRSEALAKTYKIIQNELKRQNKPDDFDYDEDTNFREQLNNLIKKELSNDYKDIDPKILETIITDATSF
jgi:hypothetical protein